MVCPYFPFSKIIGVGYLSWVFPYSNQSDQIWVVKACGTWLFRALEVAKKYMSTTMLTNTQKLRCSRNPFHCGYISIHNTGWWFGCFFIFPYIGNNHPNWLIFFREVQTTNQNTYNWHCTSAFSFLFRIERPVVIRTPLVWRDDPPQKQLIFILSPTFKSASSESSNDRFKFLQLSSYISYCNFAFKWNSSQPSKNPHVHNLASPHPLHVFFSADSLGILHEIRRPWSSCRALPPWPGTSRRSRRSRRARDATVVTRTVKRVPRTDGGGAGWMENFGVFFFFDQLNRDYHDWFMTKGIHLHDYIHLYSWNDFKCDTLIRYGSFLKQWYPQMDGLQWKIPLKWMMTGGTPILGNPHMVLYIHFWR